MLWHVTYKNTVLKGKSLFFPERFTRMCQMDKNEKRILCTHTNTIQGIVLHTMTSNLLFWNSRERAHPLSEGKANFIVAKAAPGIKERSFRGKRKYGSRRWRLSSLHKHFKRKELQEVPRGQSHSFPILAPFRTAHCSPASHCQQHKDGYWGPKGASSWERGPDHYPQLRWKRQIRSSGSLGLRISEIGCLKEDM